MGNIHNIQQKLCLKEFTSKKLEKFVDLFDDNTQELICLTCEKIKKYHLRKNYAEHTIFQTSDFESERPIAYSLNRKYIASCLRKQNKIVICNTQNKKFIVSQRIPCKSDVILFSKNKLSSTLFQFFSCI